MEEDDDDLAFGLGPLSSVLKCTETITHVLNAGPISVLTLDNRHRIGQMQ